MLDGIIQGYTVPVSDTSSIAYRRTVPTEHLTVLLGVGTMQIWPTV